MSLAIGFPNLSVLLPCYNESASVLPVVLDLQNELKRLQTKRIIKNFEIILIDDGSTDDSLNQAQKISHTGLKIIRLETNQGYGAALKAGFRQAQYQALSFLDLDQTCLAKDLSALLKKFRQQGGGMVSGLRLHEKSKMPWIRRLGNRMYALLCGFGNSTQLKDVCSGYRILEKKRYLKVADRLPDLLDFTLALTLEAQESKWPLGEVPINYQDRKGQSKLHVLKDGLRFLSTILKAKIRKMKRIFEAKKEAPDFHKASVQQSCHKSAMSHHQ